jgi:hypothetical protein
MAPSSRAASFSFSQAILIATSKRSAKMKTHFQRLPCFSTALSSPSNLMISKRGNQIISEDTAKIKLDALNDQITELNGGIPLNVRSPKQVSTAIFGGPQKATKSVLTKVATATESKFSSEKQILAKLILESRTLLQQIKKDGVNEEAEKLMQAKEMPTETQHSPQKVLTDAEVVDSLFSDPNSKIDPYWKEPLYQLTKSTARTLLKQLNSESCPMGYDPSSLPKRSVKITTAAPTAGKKGTFLSYCRMQKDDYPQCVILVS